jgi:Glycosyltransferase
MKKVIMIDHSYHKKTNSSSFFSTLLQERFELRILYDESWKGEDYLNLEFIDDGYDAVIFFQSISMQMVNQVKCKNIIYVPMYDGVYDCDMEYWYNFKNIKILSFSKTLYDKLKPYGFDIMHVQYFPKANELKLVNEQNVFFWSRVNEINWNVVKTLISKTNISSVHIHKAVDPEQQFMQPDLLDEKNFNITYSEWFNTREDYYKCLEEKSMYIAPRLYEGIGFSFLEAMAMGKVVIAVDHPMMNEYIVHGENGFLFSIDNIQPIEIKDIKMLQMNAYNTIVEGRERWKSSIVDILNFIEEPIKIENNIMNKMEVECVLFKIKKTIKKIIKCLMPYGLVRIYQKYYKKQG